jgi:hypothetical protein
MASTYRGSQRAAGLDGLPVADDTLIDKSAFWQRSVVEAPSWGARCRISATSTSDGV